MTMDTLEQAKLLLIDHFKDYPGSVACGHAIDGKVTTLQLRVFKNGNPPPKDIPTVWYGYTVKCRISEESPKAL